MSAYSDALSAAAELEDDLESIIRAFQTQSIRDVRGAALAARRALESDDFVELRDEYEEATVRLRSRGVGSEKMAICLDARLLAAHSIIDSVSRSAIDGKYAAGNYVAPTNAALQALQASCSQYEAEAEAAAKLEEDENETSIVPWVVGAGAVVVVGIAAWWAFGGKG